MGEQNEQESQDTGDESGQVTDEQRPRDVGAEDEPVTDDDAGATADAQPDGETADDDDEGDAPGDAREESEEETRRRQEEFAREHDPADHDVAAGEEFRQPGDWTADEDGPQELETDQSTLAATGSSSEGAADEGVADEGSSDEGASDDGSSDEGVADEGSSDEGASDDGSSDEGASDDGSSDEEVRDGGHGWGSAAPRSDGNAPEGHPVKAWHDTMTYVLPEEEGYDADPHECFVDVEVAERAGFRHAHG